MSNIRTNRLLHELKLMTKGNGENNIFYQSDEENINKVIVMLIGPEDTPYEKGFYFFKCKYPDNYPFEPIKVKFLTTDMNTRMNPNLYQSGKVCLSILGTWSGPSWTSCQTIISVFLSIMCEIFIKEPFRNEPGMERSTINLINRYNIYIQHENLRLAVIKNMNYPINENFKNIILKYISDNKEKYIEYFNKIKIPNSELTTPLWNIKISNNYEQLLNIFNSKISNNNE